MKKTTILNLDAHNEFLYCSIPLFNLIFIHILLILIPPFPP